MGWNDAMTIGGSSPRARGTQLLSYLGVSDGRFIPAGAGNTRDKTKARRPRAVHPRGRGEHRRSTPRPASSTGSSPRARGTQKLDQGSAHSRRFIPAGAGNTSSAARPTSTTPVHPRGRGEHEVNHDGIIRGNGSSPRARGTLVHRRRGRRCRRFIPAGAGNTRIATATATAITVHPRGRGEHGKACVLPACQAGSSPRARGTHGRPCRRSGEDRFIPAGAGNTARTRPTKARPTVHPRGRGEHEDGNGAHRIRHGSSPRARGTQQRVDLLHHLGRFIPAGAGNT